MADNQIIPTNEFKINPVPYRAIDITNQKFGRWHTIGYSYSINRKGYWVFQCECGTQKVIEKYTVTSGQSQSCGCLRQELKCTFNYRHGLTYNRLYYIWRGMLRRCYNVQDDSYPNYGGKGITVCNRWRFGENGKIGAFYFIADMGEKPSPQHSIERINNDLGYSPENCKWATKQEQANNRKTSQKYEFDGQTMSLPEWAEFLGISKHMLVQRIKRLGWNIQDALTKPSNTHPKKS